MALNSLTKERNFNMIINIKNEEGEVQYDVNQIADEDKKRGATVTISKVGSLETIIEALQFASSTHRSNLENLLKETPEALVESETPDDVEEAEVVAEEDTTEDSD